jgi:peptidoglycan/LPS O-acetylase OafA/YrhL
MPDLNRETNYIPTLDGWRGVAILLVLVDHATEGLGSGLVHSCMRLGATGVGLFFALSGFLITTRLLEETERRGRVDLKKFYIRRAFRLIPASLTYLLAIAFLSYLGALSLTGKQWFASLLFFRNYIPMDLVGGGWFTSHFWSLAIEEHFYLLWPALLILTRRRPIVPAAIAVGVAAWRYVDLHFHIVSANLWFQGRTDVRLDGLLWGCVLAMLLKAPGVKERISRSYSWALWLSFLGLDVVSNLFSGKHNYSPYEPLLIAAIIVWPVLNEKTWLGKMLQMPALKWVGRLSYSIYVWQQLWLLFPGVAAPFGPLQRLPLNIPCVFGSAALSYYLIERTMIRLGHRVTTSLPKPSYQPVAAEDYFTPIVKETHAHTSVAH